MTSHNQKLDEALDALRDQVRALVREEQLRDHLTGLANGQALSELLKNEIDAGGGYWLAFVEVDYFKRINDRFSYELADGLLKRIGKRLISFTDYVANVMPIRAHGDEFYLFGQLSPKLDPDRIGAALEQLRAEIAAIALPTDRGDMSCTVSVGWMTTDDGGEEPLTERITMRMVEAAVGAAKVAGRNRVVRYSPEVKKAERRSHRDDCRACEAAFTVEIPTDFKSEDPLFCPNCGVRLTRPVVMTSSSKAAEAADIDGSAYR
ncbi:MAG: GGDEF domain-containing protein [Polyangiaceae bacterium]